MKQWVSAPPGREAWKPKRSFQVCDSHLLLLFLQASAGFPRGHVSKSGVCNRREPLAGEGSRVYGQDRDLKLGGGGFASLL